MSAEIPSSGQLRTRRQKDQAKKIGNICGFFALGRGQPTKAKRRSKDADQPVLYLKDHLNAVAKKNKSCTTSL